MTVINYIGNTPSALITEKDAQHILWVVGSPSGIGYEPGSFTTKLIESILAADTSNRELLAIAYPGLVQGIRIYGEERWGHAYLRWLAGGEEYEFMLHQHRIGDHMSTPEPRCGQCD